MVRRLTMLLVVVLALAGVRPVASSAPAWTPDPPTFGVVATNDVPIQMADGRVLRALLHEPALPDGRPAPGPFPVILWLTPYGKSVATQIDDELVRRGYIGISVDVAGTGGSEGASQLFGATEADDSRAIVDWAAQLPRSNGKVGMSGTSYLGIAQLFAAAAVGPGSPLKAIFPIAASADPYRDLFVSGGVVNLESPAGLLAAYAGVRTLTPLAERVNDPLDALRLTVEHALQAVPFEATILLDTLLEGDRRYDGAYWSSRAPINVVPRIVENDVAVFLVGGQYDVFQRGEPLLYAGMQNAAAGRPVTAPMAAGQPVDGRFQLLYGPWHHGNQGEGVDLVTLQLRWFDHWLKGRDTGIADTTTPLHVIEPGGRSYDTATYPVTGATPTRFNLDIGGGLTTGTPSGGPGDTLPFTAVLTTPCSRSSQQWSAGALPEELCGDRRLPSDPLPTELGYSTGPLAAPLSIAGPIGLTLEARSTSPDTMWTARLEAVAPDGSVNELSAGALLGSLRSLDEARSWPAGDGGWLLPYHHLTKERRQPVPVGERVRYDLEIRPVFQTVPAGHRLRLVVGSADVPHLIPTLYDGAGLLGGVYTIDHDPAAPSYLSIPIVPN
ncbi:MAG: CocE/NonD family hydrolase [Actinomycetota bacterium]|nr:CocE/NonD family hydrolase [Actinomycetota bacterium]